MSASIWQTGPPPVPHRIYVVFYEGGFYGLATWTGGGWLPFADENVGVSVEGWMFLPDGPGARGAGQPRKTVVRL